MNLESFSSELLLDLFEYIPAVSLFRSFYNLNYRFNNLILIHLQSFDLNFQSISQCDFNFISLQYLHLPSIANVIVSLSLSNDDDTPQQIDLFLDYGLKLSQFINLKSLTIYDLCSNKIMNMLMVQWKTLENLTHLTLAGCYIQFDQTNAQRLVDSIWSLPKLIYCYLNVNVGEHDILVPTVMSSSLKNVFIWGSEHTQNKINDLIKQTPYLQKFSVLLNMDSNDNNNNNLRDPFLSITKLELSISRINESSIREFLQNMPNLYRLIIDLSNLDIDYPNTILNGYQWENIILNHLPKLRIFRFRIEFQIIAHNNRQEKINDLINSFRTPFWCEQHNWFIRCHWNPLNPSSSIYLYSLPYSFNYINFDPSMIITSTSPADKYFKRYNHVRNLKYEDLSNEEIISSSIEFPNLQSLSLKLPANSQLWSIIPNFDQIKSLTISLNDNISIPHQFQFLLDHMPNVYSLSFNSSSSYSSPISLLTFENLSIHKLDLRGCNQYFDDEQCNMICNSSFGIQCEVLFIKVKTHRIILDLLNNMIKLRVLNVQCENDMFGQTGEDVLITWLKQTLSRTCTINRDPFFHCDTRIWIR